MVIHGNKLCHTSIYELALDKTNRHSSRLLSNTQKGDSDLLLNDQNMQAAGGSEVISRGTSYETPKAIDSSQE